MMLDPRGPRFAAALTSIVLALVLLTASTWLLAAQTLVFGLSALRGPQLSPYGVLFRRFIRPRLASPSALESAGPPQFAQGVGFALAVAGTVALALGATGIGLVAAGVALVAALLNAVFGLCLGCELYLIGKRTLPSRTSSSTNVSPTSEEISV